MNNKVQVKQVVKDNIIFVGILFFWMIVAYCVPTGGDDWEISTWYREDFITTLVGDIKAWGTLNGRVMNNLWDSFFSKYRITWNIVSAIVHVSTLYFVAKIFGYEKKKGTVLYCFLMYLSVADMLRAETQFHVIANISYTICNCMIFMYIYIYYMCDAEEKVVPFQQKKYNLLFWGIYALVVSLWIENLTVGFTGVLIALAIWGFYKKRKWNTMLIGAMIGDAVGCCVMFSSVGIGNRVDSSLSLFETIEQNLPAFLDHLVISNGKVYILFSISIILAIKYGKLMIKNKIIKYGYVLWNLVVVLIFAIDEALVVLERNYITIDSMKILRNELHSGGIITLVFSLLVLFSIIVAIVYSTKCEKMLVLYFSAFMSVAPMILSPGARNMLFAIWVVIAIAGYYLSTVIVEGRDKVLILKLCLGVLIFLRVEEYSFHLLEAVEVEKERKTLIEEYKVRSRYAQNVDDYTIILPRMSEAFVGNFNSDYYTPGIITYYGLPEETIVLFEDDFLVREFEIVPIDKDKIQIVLDQYERYGNEYVYYFTIMCDGEVVLETESIDSCVEVICEEDGIYSAECLITNKKNMTQKNIVTKNTFERKGE